MESAYESEGLTDANFEELRKELDNIWSFEIVLSSLMIFRKIQYVELKFYSGLSNWLDFASKAIHYLWLSNVSRYNVTRLSPISCGHLKRDVTFLDPERIA